MSSKTTDKEGQESAAESTNSEAQAMPSSTGSASPETMGACFYVDAEGQNRCIVTTASMCMQMSNSKFYPGKNCPDI